MLFELISVSIQIVIQTLFLLAAFWVMIKLQKLEYNFPGLLASAALIGTLDEVLNAILMHFEFGIYLASSITTPIVVCVSYLCIAKVTGAELVDVFFTVIVGRALWFGMNLFLIGTLMGDLRPAAADDNEPPSVAEQRQAITEGAPMRAWTNQPPPSAPPASNAPAAPAVSNAPAAPSPSAQEISVQEIAKRFAIKGIMRNGANSAVTIQFGARTYALFVGDTVMMQTDDGPVTVGFKGLDADAVVLTIKGIETKLPYHAH